MDRNREEIITLDTFSLEQLLSKFNSDFVKDEVKEEFPGLEKSLLSKDYHHQPLEETVNLAANEPKKLSCSVQSKSLSKVADRSKEESPEELAQCQVEISNKDANHCTSPCMKRIADRLLLLLLISVISIGMILAFYFTVGTTIHERSSSVKFDFTLDEACDSVSIYTVYVYTTLVYLELYSTSIATPVNIPASLKM